MQELLQEQQRPLLLVSQGGSELAPKGNLNIQTCIHMGLCAASAAKDSHLQPVCHKTAFLVNPVGIHVTYNSH